MEQNEQVYQKSELELALDREETKAVKRKLRRYRIFRSFGWVLAFISIACIVAATFLTTKFYNDFIGVSAAAPAEERKASYVRALKIAPGKTDAYLKLLNLYGEDGIFTNEESQEFLGLYNKYHKKLSWRDDYYTEVHYTAAFLYLNGYDGTSPVKLRMALPFLDTAMETISEEDPGYSAVACYSKIGNYYRTYIWDAAASIREVSPQQMQELMTEIAETLTSFEGQTSGESLYNKLGFFEAVCNLLYDQRDILAVTVKEETVTVILEYIYSHLPDESTIQKEQTRAILQNLVVNKETYVDLIHRAFERSVPG